jgi:hypothetical protein
MRVNRHLADGGKIDGEFPPALKGLMLALPVAKGTWTTKDRAKFMAAFNAVLDMTITVDDSAPESQEVEEEGSEVE